MWNFDDWFEVFWARFPKELCSNQDKGNKQEAMRAARSKVKSAKKAKLVDDNTEAWVRFKRYKIARKEFTPYFKQVVRWFRYECYNDEIPSYSEVETPQREIKGKQHPSHTIVKPNEQKRADPGKALSEIKNIRAALK